MSTFSINDDLKEIDLILKSDYIIILGQTPEGAKFRPSDWCDRLYSTLRALSEEDYEECKEFVFLVNTKLGKGICLNCELNSVKPILFNFFINFVKSNNLTVKALMKNDLAAEMLPH